MLKKLQHIFNNPTVSWWIAFGASFVGLLVATYLWYEYQQPSAVGCVVGGAGCETVRLSEFSQIAGIDLPVFGILFYLVLAIYVTTRFLDRPVRRFENWGLQLATLFGLIFSVYLTYLELFVIHAICTWCVMSAIAATVLFIGTQLALRADTIVRR